MGGNREESLTEHQLPSSCTKRADKQQLLPKTVFSLVGLGIETSRVAYSGLETQLSTKMLVTEAQDLGFSTQ